MEVKLKPKCTSLFFTLKISSGPSLTINDSALGLTSTHWDLGIIVSADLLWSQHISKVCSFAYKVLYFIRRNVYSSHSDVLKSLYISLVRSKLLYCSQLWSPHCLKDVTCLETIQRRMTRFFLLHFSPDSPCTFHYICPCTSCHLQ
uniref:Alkylated DNA repair protein AlkB homologue 8 N-terminal domain-containing protein n=1 Tax=Amphimedon queenslandica TaxID=400682 RepID=A0A1X7TAX6_AMPQE